MYEALLNRFPNDWRRVRNSPRTILTQADRRQDEDDAAAVRLTELLELNLFVTFSFGGTSFNRLV